MNFGKPMKTKFFLLYSETSTTSLERRSMGWRHQDQICESAGSRFLSEATKPRHFWAAILFVRRWKAGSSFVAVASWACGPPHSRRILNIWLQQEALWDHWAPTAIWPMDFGLHATRVNHRLPHHAGCRRQTRLVVSLVQIQGGPTKADLGRLRMWVQWDGAELPRRTLRWYWILRWRVPQLLPQMPILLWVQALSRVRGDQHVIDGAN